MPRWCCCFGGGAGSTSEQEGTEATENSSLVETSVDSSAAPAVAPLPDFLKASDDHDPLAAAMRSTNLARSKSKRSTPELPETAQAGRV
jgi:hypothetical protein